MDNRDGARILAEYTNGLNENMTKWFKYETDELVSTYTHGHIDEKCLRGYLKQLRDGYLSGPFPTDTADD